ncbi:hypothetical protein UF66_0645 [Staphylococcus cohnii subsp. cohnii]|uniref:Uncharacterized protein n=1 Tax=Staphylococcus cohnii subsp. cohnii TaxID=74704 RepID=A0A0M2P109_STACC|nr:hypothetical protein UF66_0645 [Staphylococcus cohnii subsp. cohnii]
MCSTIKSYVSWNSSSVSPGKPTMTSLVTANPGSASCKTSQSL